MTIFVSYLPDNKYFINYQVLENVARLLHIQLYIGKTKNNLVNIK